MIIIGISGKKQSGKSTFVEHLLGKIPGSTAVRFADCLKQIILDCFVPEEFGWTSPDDLDSDKRKNMELPCGKTVRQMLQIVGTDWFRKTWNECWINAYKKRLKAMYSYTSRGVPTVVFTPDVRFPNELQAIHGFGGFVFRLLRAPFGEEDQHESETALDVCTDQCLLSANQISPMEGVFVIPDAARLPAPMFDLLFDNKEMTLEETQIWIDNVLMKCFNWTKEQDGGISNISFSLERFL